MKKLDLSGEKFGLLSVIEAGKQEKSKTTWLCRCECGGTVVIKTAYLRNGDTKSCGCFQKKNPSNLKHGHNRAGARSRVYGVWSSMKTRCSNPAATDYQWYGAKGIKVSKRWMLFDNFLADMGSPGDGMTIDRINPKGNYCKSNCRWLASSENTARAFAKNYTLVSPGGDVVEIYNLAAFARDNNLSLSGLSSVTTERCAHHKGWTLP